jgi:hypothetical protein
MLGLEEGAGVKVSHKLFPIVMQIDIYGQMQYQCLIRSHDLVDNEETLL